MKITMLAENHIKECDSKLKSEHGLSMLIESGDKKILFDTGSSGVFIENAETMGIDVKNIDIVILSHAHIDHAGGLVRLLELNTKAKVYMSIHAKERYSIRTFGIPINISVPIEVFDKFNERINFVDSNTQISNDTYIISNISEHPYSLTKTSKNLLIRRDKKFIKDSFDHKIILVINYDEKLNIFTGCSHNGVENMIKACREYFPDTPVHTVIGGFHLMGIPFRSLLGETKESIKAIGERVLEQDIIKVYTCHCTGMKAYGILKDIMKDKIEYFSTGMQIEF